MLIICVRCDKIERDVEGTGIEMCVKHINIALHVSHHITACHSPCEKGARPEPLFLRHCTETKMTTCAIVVHESFFVAFKFLQMFSHMDVSDSFKSTGYDFGA